MSRATGEAVAAAGYKYLGVGYDRMDCQAFVEKCLEDCGIKKDLAGSNSWYRFVIADGWAGTPEECRKKYGEIPVGAFLFILEQDGKEPAKFRGDGVGNASHIGIYTGQREGAIHSSQTIGIVTGSKFSGKSINGSWNRVGLWNQIDYGGKVSGTQSGGGAAGGGGKRMESYKATVKDGRLALRKKPDQDADRITWIPDGTEIDVYDEKDGWCQTSFGSVSGWVKKEFLKIAEDENITITIQVKKRHAETILNFVDALQAAAENVIGRG